MNVLLWSGAQEGAKRRRVVVVSEAFFASWWTTSEPDAWQTFRCKEGLPEGALLVAVAHDPERNEFRFIFEHESFPEVPSGSMIPAVNIMFEMRRPDDIGGPFDLATAEDGVTIPQGGSVLVSLGPPK